MEELPVITGAVDNQAIDLGTEGEVLQAQDLKVQSLEPQEWLALQPKHPSESSLLSETLQKLSIHAPSVTDALPQRHPRESGDPDLFPAKAGNQTLYVKIDFRVKPEEEVCVPAFAGMTLSVGKALYSAFYQLNDFLKYHDPFPDFPLPKVHANRGGGAARAAATAYRPSYTPAQHGYDTTINAMFRASANNARGANLATTTNGNPIQSGGSTGSLTWMEAQRYNPDPVPRFSSDFGFDRFDTSTYSNYNPNNVYNPINTYGPGPFQSVVRSYSQMADTNNFGYQHGPSFASSPLTSPLSSPFISPTISQSFSNNPFSFSPVVSSSPIISPPSFSTNSFSPSPRTEFTFQPVKLEPLSTIQTMPDWQPMPLMPPTPIPFREVIGGFSAEELAQQQAQYEAAQREAEQAWQKRKRLEGWTLGSNFVLFHTMPSESELRLEEEARRGKEARAKDLEKLREELGEEWLAQYAKQYAEQWVEGTALTFILESPEAKCQYDTWRAQVANEISPALQHLYGMLYAHNIWVDINYIHTILFLPIELVVNLLENGCLADMLLERARIKPYQTAQSPTGSSGRNNGGNGTGTDFSDAIKKLFEERNSLNDHEYGSHDGHAIMRHVAVSKEQLERRLKRDFSIQGATSFPDLNTANKYVWETLKRNEDKIREWFLNSNKPYDFFTAEFSETVGYGYNRAGQYSDFINTVRVKLVRNGQYIFVQTAYPLYGK